MTVRRPPGPILTVAVWDSGAQKAMNVAWDHLLPNWSEEDLAQIERLWVSPEAPPANAADGDRPAWESPWLPPYGTREADFLQTAIGHAHGRWLLTLRAGERLEIRNPRTFLRYIRHVPAAPDSAPQDPDLFLVPVSGLRTARAEHLPRLLNPDTLSQVAHVHRDLVKAWLGTHPWGTMATLSSVHLVPAPCDARTVGLPGTAALSGWPDFMRELSLGRRDFGPSLTRNVPGSRFGLAPLPLPMGLDVAAESAFWRGDLDGAQGAWQSALDADLRPSAPVLVRAHLGLARVSEVRGDLDEALRRYAAISSLAPGEPESLARLSALAFRLGEPWAARVSALRVPLRTWQGIARALDRVVPPHAQREGLSAVAPGPLRDLLLARAALRTGDPGLALRTLRISDLAQGVTEEARDVHTYASYLAELASGRAEAARNLVLSWAGLSQAGRTALLASERIVGQRMQVPDLPEEEDVLVRQWILLVADDLGEMGLEAQAQQLKALADRSGDYESVSKVLGTRLATSV